MGNIFAGGDIIRNGLIALVNGVSVNLTQTIGTDGGAMWLAPRSSGWGAFFRTLFGGWIGIILSYSIRTGSFDNPL